MNTFNDLYWQTDYKRALINSYKKERASKSLHAIILERGECEQSLSVAHPDWSNGGHKATRATRSAERIRINTYCL